MILARSKHGHHGGIEALTAAPLNIILLSLLSFALYKEVAHYVLVATVKIDKSQENDTDWRYSTKKSANIRDKVQDAVDLARVEFPVLTHFKSYRVLPVVLIWYLSTWYGVRGEAVYLINSEPSYTHLGVYKFHMAAL